MKQSGIDWIGEIPDDWKINQLSQIVSQVKNKNTGLKENNLLSLSYGKIKRKNINTNDGLLPASFDGYNIITDGDIVLRLTDLQNDHTSLRVGRATEQGIITSAYTTLHPVDYNNSKYLYYILHSFDLKKGFYGMGSGVRQGLNYDEVKTLKVPLPPKAIQQRIAEYLDLKCAQIDSIIQESKKSIEEYKTWKQSVIFEAVTGKNLSCEKEDSGIEWIGEIPEDWKVRKVKYSTKLISGYSFDSNVLTPSGKNIVIRIGDIKNGTVDIANANKSDFEIAGLSNFAVEKDDVLVAMSGATVGKLGYIYTPIKNAYINQRVGILRSSNSKFLYYALNTDKFIEYIMLKSNGSAQPNISNDDIKNYPICVPPLSEQESIAKMLDSKCAQIDSLIAEKESLIADLTEYKKSLIFEVVTGKRMV